MRTPRWHGPDRIAAALESIDVLGAVRDAFVCHSTGNAVLAPQTCLYWQAPDSGSARSLAMHAYLGADEPRVGIKLINAAPNNVGRGLPRAEGIIALFDPLSARITDLLPAAEISATRTAAVSVLAAQSLCARSKTLAMIGAGAIAAKHLQLLAAADLGVESVEIFDVDGDRASRLADEIEASSSLRCVVASSAQAAVCDADMVIAATTATEPYLPFSWLAPGTLVINVSLDDLCDDVFAGADAIFVDDLDAIVADPRRRLGRLLRDGKIDARRPGELPIRAELGDLLAGRKRGRLSDEEILVVNPFGIAISDIALAAAVCA